MIRKVHLESYIKLISGLFKSTSNWQIFNQLQLKVKLKQPKTQTFRGLSTNTLSSQMML